MATSNLGVLGVLKRYRWGLLSACLLLPLAAGATLHWTTPARYELSFFYRLPDIPAHVKAIIVRSLSSDTLLNGFAAKLRMQMDLEVAGRQFLACRPGEELGRTGGVASVETVRCDIAVGSHVPLDSGRVREIRSLFETGYLYPLFERSYFKHRLGELHGQLVADRELVVAEQASLQRQSEFYRGRLAALRAQIDSRPAGAASGVNLSAADLAAKADPPSTTQRFLQLGHLGLVDYLPVPMQLIATQNMISKAEVLQGLATAENAARAQVIALVGEITDRRIYESAAIARFVAEREYPPEVAGSAAFHGLRTMLTGDWKGLFSAFDSPDHNVIVAQSRKVYQKVAMLLFLVLVVSGVFVAYQSMVWAPSPTPRRSPSPDGERSPSF